MGETFNKYLFVPQIMLHLYAGMNNKYTQKSKYDDKVVRLVAYFFCFHFADELGRMNQAKLLGVSRA